MVAVLAPQPQNPPAARRPALRVVVSTPIEPAPLRRAPAARREAPAVYRRRRLAVALTVATAVVAVLLVRSAVSSPVDDLSVVTAASGDAPSTAAVEAPAAVDAPAGATPAPQVYIVRPGDTVWTIAERLEPDGDVRGLVDQLTERAGGSGLQAGQRIALDGLGL